MLLRRFIKTRLLVVGGFSLLGVLNTGCSMAPGTPLIAPVNDRAIYGGNPPAVAVQPSPAFNNVAQGMNLPTGHAPHATAQRQPVGPPVYGSGGAVVPIGYQPQPQPQPVQHPGYPQGYVPVMPHYQPQPVPVQPSTGVIPASGQPQIQVVQTPQGPQYIIVEGAPAQPQVQPQPAPVQPSNPAGTPVSNTTPVAPGGAPSLSAPSPGFVPAPGLPAAFDKSKGPELPTPPTATTPVKEPTPGGPSIHEDDIPLAPGFLPQQR